MEFESRIHNEANQVGQGEAEGLSEDTELEAESRSDPTVGGWTDRLASAHSVPGCR